MCVDLILILNTFSSQNLFDTTPFSHVMTKSVGSYGNNTLVICCPALSGRPCTNKSLGCCSRTPSQPWSILKRGFLVIIIFHTVVVKMVFPSFHKWSYCFTDILFLAFCASQYTYIYIYIYTMLFTWQLIDLDHRKWCTWLSLLTLIHSTICNSGLHIYFNAVFCVSLLEWFLRG